MMKKGLFLFPLLAVVAAQTAFSQGERKDKTAVTFEELYDEPYSANKLFIGFQPFYGDVFATNVNAGYGVEASYYLKDKMDFKANIRKSYSAKFYDMARNQAQQSSSPGVKVEPEIYNYYEFGATYHVKDVELDGKTTMVLYKNSYTGDRWASRVPLHAEIPCKVRKIYGVRLGTIIWNSATDLTRALDRQKLTYASLKNAEGIGLPTTYVDANGQTQKFSAFGNIYAANIYAGGSIAWFRNVAVSFDKFDDAVDDGMLTVFFDLQYAPLLKMDPIKYTDPTTKVTENYSTSALKMIPIGARAGIDGKFNRTLSWAYGGEIGYRPSLQGRAFYALLKITFPIFGTNLDYKVESFGK
jgi:hypothetical protein